MANDSTPAADSQTPDTAPIIVGVGASTGGFDAFQRLIEQFPAGSPLAIAFVLHLLPSHESMLAELLSRASPMTAVDAYDGQSLEAGCIYVIPPDVYMEYRDGKIKLFPRAGELGAFLPIDRFFMSLAREAGERAIGVVLSGMGSDGAIGLRQIKEAGGVTFCQSPESAEQDEMPRAAMATGDADFVLSPADIGKTLLDLAQHPYVAKAPDKLDSAKLRPSEEDFYQIFAMLRTSSGVDFSHYKRPTLQRRLLRRMALHKITNVAEYIRLLESRPQEANELYRDILINVTFFFREPLSFTALTEKAFPRLFDQRKPEEPLRIWAPGCSTGEEPYSLAISLAEFMARQSLEVPVQIFATDVSENAIETARAGLYSDAAVRPLSPERLRRFFTPVDGKYRINKKIREMCVFARHDLARDPPFSRCDLVVCRNVLIYLDQMLQKRLLTAFHYALKPNGFLMLGSAETVGMQGDMFAIVDKKHRLYSKRAGAARPLDYGFADSGEGLRPALLGPKPPREHVIHRTVQQEVNQLILSKYAPPGVLVNDKLEIVQFRGQTGYFLEPPPGEVNLHVLKMVRAGLLHDLRDALDEARKSHAAVRKEDLHVAFNGHGREVNLEVIPILAPDEAIHFLILFEDLSADAEHRLAPLPRRQPKKPDAPGEEETETEQLRRELETTRKYLQAAIQDLEVNNEELQSANEEVISSNEELQSTNEELDTAKEELQSTNEELNTLNAELHSRNEELSRVNSDLVNLLSSVQIAVVMVDRALCIRRFTPAAEKLFNLIPTDVGRPIQHLKPNIVYPELERRLHQVIDEVQPLEEEIQDAQGSWFLLRIRPYCSVDNRIEGAVVALLDIDAIKRRPSS